MTVEAVHLCAIWRCSEFARSRNVEFHQLRYR